MTGPARRTGAVLAAVLAVLTSLVPVSARPAAATTHDDALPVTVEVTRVAPQVLRPGQDLSVQVTVRNTGSTPVAEPRVVLGLDRRGFISRSALDRWRGAGPDGAAGTPVAEVDLGVPLAAGATATATVTLPATSVGLRRGETSWGPRGISAQVVDVTEPARTRLGIARTFALWYPVEEVTATRLTVLVPLVGPPVSAHDDAWARELDALTSGGRLAAVLDATAGQPDVSWALDPWLVDVGAAADAAADDAGTDEDGATDEGDGSAGGTGEGTGDGTGDGTTGGTQDDAADPGAAGADGPDAAAEPDATGAEGEGAQDPSTGADGADQGTDDGPDQGTSDGTDEGTGEGTDEGSGGVDPSDDAPGGAGSSASDPLVSDSVTAWVERLLAATTDRDLHVLPYLDADVSALAHAADTRRVAVAQELAQDVLERSALPDGAQTSVMWPTDPLPDLATAAFASRAGARALVVGPGELAWPSVLTYTPSGRTTVETSAGEVTVLVPDERLSTALATGAFIDADDVTDQAPLTPATAAQSVLAELAVVTRERPSDARHLLATAPRDWHPDVEVARAQLAALAAAPWVRTDPVSALVGGEDTGVDRGTLPERDVDDDEVSPAELATVDEALAARRRLAALVDDPATLLGDTELELVAPAGAAWRSDPQGRADAVEATVAATDALRGTVRVVPGSTTNILATSGGLRVRVRNDLAQDATVVIELRPADFRLRPDGAVTVTVPAGDEASAWVPVHAIQSADIDVVVQLSTTGGEVVDESTVQVRVRAEWEGIGTAVLGALLALGVVVGVVRTIRRGRTGRRAEPQLTAGPDALSPEAIDDATSPAPDDDVATDPTDPSSPPPPAPSAPSAPDATRTSARGAG
ncbi:DUF6049 family protein [Cellulomonas carbonis]|uniref:Uncharacterized protein n=1 Tax=Cellulomonas carbonis T26 TaxID=947969 RepID=A0A0A0BNA9_9CELL|nr:DUF6049 family protein [Cellulomonas carbonis]KGM09405.1 hypothetical protein N868_01095 [Cellulomonas carbonis T26]GGC01095.1 hypothetical protein GCM10010972_12370 [Cellulomonas carbonis]